MHHGGDIDIELALQQRRVGIGEFTRRAEPGIVDQHRHPGFQSLDDPVAVGRYGQIGGQHFNLDTVGGAQLRGEINETVDIAGNEHQVVSVTREPTGVPGPQTRSGAGYQGGRTWHPATLSARGRRQASPAGSLRPSPRDASDLARGTRQTW